MLLVASYVVLLLMFTEGIPRFGGTMVSDCSEEMKKGMFLIEM